MEITVSCILSSSKMTQDLDMEALTRGFLTCVLYLASYTGFLFRFFVVVVSATSGRGRIKQVIYKHVQMRATKSKFDVLLNT